MEKSGKWKKLNFNSYSEQRNTGKDKDNKGSNSFGQHDDGHTHQQRRPGNSTNTHSHNTTAPSSATTRSSQMKRKARHHGKKEDNSHSGESADLNIMNKELNLRTQSKRKSPALGKSSHRHKSKSRRPDRTHRHTSSSKASHHEHKQSVSKVLDIKKEDHNIRTQHKSAARGESQVCNEQNKLCVTVKKSSTSSSHRHKSKSHKTDRTHRHTSSSKASHHKHKRNKHHSHKKCHSRRKHGKHHKKSKELRSPALDEEMADVSGDEYMYLHGYDEEDNQPRISYYNIDPLSISAIGYATELKKLNKGIAGRADSAGNWTTNNIYGFIYPNEGMQLSSGTLSSEEKTENSKEDLRGSSVDNSPHYWNETNITAEKQPEQTIDSPLSIDVSVENEYYSNIIQTPDRLKNITLAEYEAWFYNSINRKYGVLGRRSIDTVSVGTRSSAYLSPNKQNMSPTEAGRRRSMFGSLETSLKNVRLIDESGRVRIMSHNDPPTSPNDENGNSNDFSFPMPIVTPSETSSKHRSSTDDSEPRSTMSTDHTERFDMDENVDTEVDIAIPSLSSASVGECCGVFVTPEVSSPTKQNSKRRRLTSDDSEIGNKTHHQLSAKDDFYKKPFDYGWRRELVWRSKVDSTHKADVYFISPAGKKVRSRNDIALLLEGDLTVEHFCFLHEPQGVDPVYEHVRYAKSSSRGSSAKSTVKLPEPQKQSTSSKIVKGKRSLKPMAPKGSGPQPEGWTTRVLRSNNTELAQRLNTSARTSAASRGRASSVLQVSNNTNNSFVKKHVKKGDKEN